MYTVCVYNDKENSIICYQAHTLEDCQAWVRQYEGKGLVISFEYGRQVLEV